MELTPQSGASIARGSRGLRRENQNVSQKGASKASNPKKVSAMLNYVLDLLDYDGMSGVLSNACIA